MKKKYIINDRGMVIKVREVLPGQKEYIHPRFRTPKDKDGADPVQDLLRVMSV